MRRARIVLFALLLAALPLRGFSAVLVMLCEGHHGGAGASQEQLHEHADGHHRESFDDDGGSSAHVASVCSLCASCCAGAGLAPQWILEVVVQPPGTFRIPFLEHRFRGFVPESLDRPPLVS